MLQSPSGRLPCFCYQVSDTCKHLISLSSTLICKSDRVGQKNQEPVASIGFLKHLLVLQIDINIKIQDPVVLFGCKFLPGLASYCDLLGILGMVLGMAKNKDAWGSEAQQTKACMEVCA